MKEYGPFVLAVVILLGALALYCQTAIRMEVNERLPQGNRFHWWHMNYSASKQLYQKHREFYPKSLLRLISGAALGLAIVGWAICKVLLKAI
jgi:hypothetical protein